MEDTSPNVGSGLLAHLRRVWDAPTLEYVRRPKRILGGNATFIHGFSLRGEPADPAGQLVLRLFRPDQGIDRVRVEATIQQVVARLGYPAPRVLDVCTDPSVLGAPFMVMEHVDGGTSLAGLAPTRTDAMHLDLVKLLVTLPRSIGEMPRTIAAWLARLHAIDPEPLLAELRREGVDRAHFGIDREVGRIQGMLDEAPGTFRSSFAPAMDWLRKARPQDGSPVAICHGDFHVLNVMARDGAITGVIDWTDAIIASPAYDVAQSRFLFELGPISVPRAFRPVSNLGQRALARAFVKEYRRHRDIDLPAVDYYDALRVLRELVGVVRERLIEAGWQRGSPRPTGNPWDRAGRVPQLVDRFERIAGVPVTLASQ